MTSVHIFVRLLAKICAHLSLELLDTLQSYYTSKNSGEIGNIFVHFGDFPKKSSDNTVLNSLTVFRRRKWTTIPIFSE